MKAVKAWALVDSGGNLAGGLMGRAYRSHTTVRSLREGIAKYQGVTHRIARVEIREVRK
jgi:hypothetical protein